MLVPQPLLKSLPLVPTLSISRNANRGSLDPPYLSTEESHVLPALRDKGCGSKQSRQTRELIDLAHKYV